MFMTSLTEKESGTLLADIFSVFLYGKRLQVVKSNQPFLCIAIYSAWAHFITCVFPKHLGIMEC